MVDSNKIGSLTRTWPTQPIKKDRPDQNKQHRNTRDDKTKKGDDEQKDPGDTIIDEYV
ncbi:MAG: hypothetical protein GKR92_01385 [Gammaproteobacteria bacterium]|nr:MAG: hypothetical protein GKR92_01385 [Gammaproteobacteria bacterium]